MASKSTNQLLLASLALGSALGLGVLLLGPGTSDSAATEVLAATNVAEPSPMAEEFSGDAGLPTSDAAPVSRERIESAVAKGLEYLRRTQDRASGGWVNDVGYKYNSNYNITNSQEPHVGVTALALMAFLSGGHIPGRGPYGDVVERGTEFIIKSVDPESGFISAHGTRMYSHAFATLFLAEIYGMTHRNDLKRYLQQAVDLTVDSQNEHGSWRYHPYSPDSDMSITVCQIMALRAARNVGIRVPKTVIDRAFDYVVRSAYSNPNHPDYGGFKYQEEAHTRTSFAVTAAGVATLNHSGVYRHELISAGISYLRNMMPSFNQQAEGHFFYWYGHYYAAQVFFIAADNRRFQHLWEGFYWKEMSSRFVDMQQTDGSWPNRVGPGPSFSTAVASIILQIPNQYLPIFHR